jgi:cytidylate kinase
VARNHEDHLNDTDNSIDPKVHASTSQNFNVQKKYLTMVNSYNRLNKMHIKLKAKHEITVKRLKRREHAKLDSKLLNVESI